MTSPERSARDSSVDSYTSSSGNRLSKAELLARIEARRGQVNDHAMSTRHSRKAQAKQQQLGNPYLTPTQYRQQYLDPRRHPTPLWGILEVNPAIIPSKVTRPRDYLHGLCICWGFESELQATTLARMAQSILAFHYGTNGHHGKRRESKAQPSMPTVDDIDPTQWVSFTLPVWPQTASCTVAAFDDEWYVPATVPVGYLRSRMQELFTIWEEHYLPHLESQQRKGSITEDAVDRERRVFTSLHARARSLADTLPAECWKAQHVYLMREEGLPVLDANAVDFVEASSPGSDDDNDGEEDEDDDEEGSGAEEGDEEDDEAEAREEERMWFDMIGRQVRSRRGKDDNSADEDEDNSRESGASSQEDDGEDDGDDEDDDDDDSDDSRGNYREEDDDDDDAMDVDASSSGSGDDDDDGDDSSRSSSSSSD